MSDHSDYGEGVKHIPLKDCKMGHLYRINSRNLILGVFDGKQGFIGIREKFGYRYLFTEFHWEQGPPFGTVQPKEDLGQIADDIGIWEHENLFLNGNLCFRMNQKLFEYLEKKESTS